MYNDNELNKQNNFNNDNSFNDNELSSKNININGSEKAQDNTNNAMSGNTNDNIQQSTIYTSNVLNNNSVDKVYNVDYNASTNQQTQNTNDTQNFNQTQNAYYEHNQTNTQYSQPIHDATSTESKVEVKAKVKKPRGKKAKVFGYVALLLVVSLLSGMAGGYVNSLMYKNNTVNNQYSQSNTGTNNGQSIAINLNNDTYYAVAVNEKAKDSVVGISTSYMQTYNSFFGTQQQPVSSIGSGFIVDSNGYILTNSHVIGDGVEANIEVTLADGSIEKGTVLWYTTDLDLAIVKIDRTGLPAAELGDSDNLLVGEPVVAIGNPMSLELNGTLTTGVISGLNRSITVDNQTIKPLIQIDASINPGNSGGPLFNAQGQVIGINTAKMSSAEGLGFSIPINVALPILEQITNTGTYKSVYLGITATSVEYYEQQMGVDFSIDEGVIIVEVVKDSPVKLAGLRSGDIITKVNDENVADMTDLKRELYKYKVGDKVTITYVRDGDEMTTEITLQERPSDM